jgi:hypothetical protein
MKPPIPVFPLYLIALFFITRSSASRGKTVMWMLITLVVTIAVFVGLAGFVSSPEAAYGLGGLGSLIGMAAAVTREFSPTEFPNSRSFLPLRSYQASVLHGLLLIRICGALTGTIQAQIVFRQRQK